MSDTWSCPLGTRQLERDRPAEVEPDAGFGLDIVDWLMEPGSDAAYRDHLSGDLTYDFNNLVHGKRAKRSVKRPRTASMLAASVNVPTEAPKRVCRPTTRPGSALSPG